MLAAGCCVGSCMEEHECKREPRRISLKELKEHNNSQSLWIAIADRVYDVTDFQVGIRVVYISQY